MTEEERTARRDELKRRAAEIRFSACNHNTPLNFTLSYGLVLMADVLVYLLDVDEMRENDAKDN